MISLPREQRPFVSYFAFAALLRDVRHVVLSVRCHRNQRLAVIAKRAQRSPVLNAHLREAPLALEVLGQEAPHER